MADGEAPRGYRPPVGDEVLVVDLDRALLHTEIAREAFWASIAGKIYACLASPLSFLHRNASTGANAIQEPGVDVTLLPYDDAVVAFVRRWREDGGRTVLLASISQELTSRIAQHLGLFDESFAADATGRFQGLTKDEFLVGQWGDQRFAYLGHSARDLPVWSKASLAITTDAPTSLRSSVDAAAQEAIHLDSGRPSTARSAMSALRPHQWLKNCLVFVPMLAAHEIDFEAFWRSSYAFVAFCLVSSSVYVLNDLLDLSADRNHPRKRLRPFASGRLSLTFGGRLAALLLAGGLTLALLLSSSFLLMMLAYWVTTTIYSLHLKRLAVIDICTLAILYTLRILAGAAATGISLSVWLLAFSMFAFLALAAVKRQAELVDNFASGGEALQGRGYRVDDLPLVAGMAIAAGYLAVLVLALYVNSEEVRVLYRSPYVLLGICVVVLYWFSRIVFVTHRGQMHDDPLVFALRDPASRVCGLVVLALAAAATLF